MKISDAGAGAGPAGSLVDTSLRSAGAGKLSQTTTASTQTASAAAGSSAPRDAASLSGLGSLLAAANTNDLRTDRVEALRAALNGGTYSVSASDVADRMMRNMLG